MFSGLFKLFTKLPSANLSIQPVRTKWATARQKNDNMRRQTIKRENITRLRINALRKNTILPPELKEVADREIDALQRNSSICRITHRCAVTGRARGTVLRWRMSRFVFRQLADHNKLAGVQRAMWSNSSPWGGREEGKYHVPISTGYYRLYRSKYTW